MSALARTMEQHCPEHDLTMDDFMITPLMIFTDFLLSIQSAFRGYDLSDINAERICEAGPSRFELIADGERILVGLGVNGKERLRPEPKMEVELFLEDDGFPKALRVCISRL